MWVTNKGYNIARHCLAVRLRQLHPGQLASSPAQVLTWSSADVVANGAAQVLVGISSFAVVPQAWHHMEPRIENELFKQGLGKGSI